MIYFYLILVALAGAGVSVQAVINSRLAHQLGNLPLYAALISFVVGSIVLFIVAFLGAQLNYNGIKQTFNQPWWLFLGGFFGAFLVFSTTFLAPKIGITNMAVAIISGQIIAGIILDSTGFLGIAIKEITINKIIALLLMVIALYLFYFGQKFFK